MLSRKSFSDSKRNITWNEHFSVTSFFPSFLLFISIFPCGCISGRSKSSLHLDTNYLTKIITSLWWFCNQESSTEATLFNTVACCKIQAPSESLPLLSLSSLIPVQIVQFCHKITNFVIKSHIYCRKSI